MKDKAKAGGGSAGQTLRREEHFPGRGVLEEEAPGRDVGEMAQPSDTIFALSSGPGRAGIAVIRVSGPAAFAIASAMTRRALPRPRHMALRWFYDPAPGEALDGKTLDGEALDQGLLCLFPAPHSFTGEDVAEFFVHGGPAVVEGVCGALHHLGARAAAPGEFTRRAFENDRLDLTEVEGLADLVAAETRAQRRQALHQMAGGLRRVYSAWRGRLLDVLAHLEAQIDFSEEDIPDDLGRRVREGLKELKAAFAAHLADNHRGERLRAGLRVVIVGPPNVGKSSLLNALARRDAAIVSDISGTTRDVIEVHLDLAGLPVCLVDTAGLIETNEILEREGVRRALRQAEQADVRIVMRAADQPAAALEAAEGPAGLTPRAEDLVVLNKVDRCTGAAAKRLCESLGRDVLPLSLKTGEGLEELIATLTQRARMLCGEAEAPGLTRARHREAVKEAASALDRAVVAVEQDIGLCAEDVRLAVRALDRIMGRSDVEEVLDRIFAEFCIGK